MSVSNCLVAHTYLSLQTSRQQAIETARIATARLTTAARDTEDELNRRLDELEQSRRNLLQAVDATSSEVQACGLLQIGAERTELVAINCLRRRIISKSGGKLLPTLGKRATSQ